MKIGNFRFGKKKKKSFLPSLDTIKTLSFITGTAIAVNKAIKEKAMEQKYRLAKFQKQDEDNTGAIIAGFIGGILAGSIAALMLAPESGDRFRGRLTGMFANRNGHETLKETLDEARD